MLNIVTTTLTVDEYSVKKNCENCLNMEWGEGDSHDPSGWVCVRKDFSNPKEESEMLDNMDRESYRKKGKVCFEPNLSHALDLAFDNLLANSSQHTIDKNKEEAE